MKTVNKEDIMYSLKLMDVSEGDVLLVHSSLTSMGYVEGGADTVIDALLEAVGPEGTISMSTLTGWGSPFDADTSPSAVGDISEQFRKRAGAYRSLHPVHSVTAIGKYAEFLTRDHETCETGCGTGTPYEKLRMLKGKVLLLGVDMDRNTIMHTLEEEIDAIYLRTLDIPAPTYLKDQDVFTLKKFPPGHRDFLAITPYLRRGGAMVEGVIGQAVVKVVDIPKLFDIALTILKENPLFFICHNPNCNSCHWSRLLFDGKPIDMAQYEKNHCCDGTCEICVI